MAQWFLVIDRDYQCLTGRAPFREGTLALALAHQHQPLPPQVAALVVDLTAKDPADRLARAGQVAERAEPARAALTATVGIARRLPPLSAWLPVRT